MEAFPHTLAMSTLASTKRLCDHYSELNFILVCLKREESGGTSRLQGSIGKRYVKCAPYFAYLFLILLVGRGFSEI